MFFDAARIRALCFDLGGTLAEADERLVRQMVAFVTRLPFLSGREAHRLARRAVMEAEAPPEAFAERLGIEDELEQLASYLRRLRASQGPEAAEAPRAMAPGVAEMLPRLAAHFPMAVLAQEGTSRAEAFLRRHGVRDSFAAVVAVPAAEPGRPQPEALRRAAEALGLPPEACLIVGDTAADIRTGIEAGAQAAGVLSGFGTREELRGAGAHLLLETTPELERVLLAEGRREPAGTSGREG